jgi:hypothetical protein
MVPAHRSVHAHERQCCSHHSGMVQMLLQRVHAKQVRHAA